MQKPEGILFSIAIPNDIMNSWIESGVIDYLKDCMDDFINTEFMEEMMNDDSDSVPQKKKKKKNKREKISKEEWNEPSEDLKKKPNYGNSHDDWSPYLKDYLPQQEPPKNEDGA
jgi:chromosomal replication initiation ATPase DnaA